MIAAPNDDIVAFGWVPGYQRNGLYALDEVHAHIGESPHDFDGDLIKMDSARYRLFQKASACICCGARGAFYAKERSARLVKSTGEFHATTNLWHFNLYALGFGGREVLMTKDHIDAYSKGGANADENYQPMCQPCNTAKSDGPPPKTAADWEAILKSSRKIMQRRKEKAKRLTRHAEMADARGL